jgi:hypothetical protein
MVFIVYRNWPCKHHSTFCYQQQYGVATKRFGKTLGLVPQANWQLKIKTPAAGGPFKLTFKGNNTIK